MPIQGVTKKGKIRYTWCFFECKVYVVWHLTFVVFSVDGFFFDEGKREIGKKRCSESIGNNDHDDNEPESGAQERMKSVNVDEEIAGKPCVDSEYFEVRFFTETMAVSRYQMLHQRREAKRDA